jgi:energy-coupling factor transporter ATP-binding protein EcfA2
MIVCADRQLAFSLLKNILKIRPNWGDAKRADDESVLSKESLEKLKCTRIVIAHRLSTIRQCDRIIVLDKGRIIEDGSYDELIAKDGFFAELVERQRVDV